MTYRELLKEAEWLDRRKSILKRDKYICVKCEAYQVMSAKSKRFNESIGMEFYNYDSILRGGDLYDIGTYPLLDHNKLTALTTYTSGGFAYREYFVPPTRRSIEEMQELKPQMHIHHKLYIQGRAPWEYEDDQLVTLCGDCHFQVHQEDDIPIYTAEMELIDLTPLPPCGRCGGSGYLSEYRHVQGGVCFSCRGCGVHIKLNERA